MRRYDNIFDVVREDTHIVQPRLGFSYLVTKNAKNVLRGSYVRLGEQMMGATRSRCSAPPAAPVRSSTIDTYDLDANGTFETCVHDAGADRIAGGRRSSIPNLHQPYLDEGILGYRMQLPHSIGIDVAGIHRVYKRHVRAHRHQRLLSERAEPAVRRLRRESIRPAASCSSRPTTPGTR